MTTSEFLDDLERRAQAGEIWTSEEINRLWQLIQPSTKQNHLAAWEGDRIKLLKKTRDILARRVLRSLDETQHPHPDVPQ